MLRAVIPLILTLVTTATLEARMAFGQVALKALVQSGTLLLPTGAYSPLDGDRGRVYGFYGHANESDQFIPEGSPSITTATAVGGIAVDSNPKDSRIYLSAGYSQQRSVTKYPNGANDSTTNYLRFYGIPVPETDDTFIRRIAVLGISGYVGSSVAWGVQYALVSVDGTRDYGGNFGSASGTAKYNDASLGLSADAMEHVRVGATISPKTTATNDSSSGVTLSVGHGDQVTVGAAYNAENFGIGADFYHYAEDTGSNSADTSGLLIAGQLKVKEFLLGATYDHYSAARLGSTVPPTDSSTLGASFAWAPPGWVLSINVSQSTASASSFGDPNLDASRFSHGTATANEFRLLKLF